MTAERPDLSVVLPALDEEPSVGAVAAAAGAAARAAGLACEVLVVDGGSQDGTVRAAEAAGARVLRQAERGFGAALREGIAAAAGSFVLTLDADGSHPLGCFARMWALRGEAEVVVASRFAPGGRADLPVTRYCASRALNWVFQRGLGVPVADSSSGYRLYRAEALRPAAAGTRARSFDFQQESLLAILAAGGRAVEVPFHYLWRAAGKSKAPALQLAGAYLRLIARGQ